MSNEDRSSDTPSPEQIVSLESDELTRLLMSSTREGLYGIDLAGRCLFANPACARLLGQETEVALRGQRMHQLIHPTRIDGSPYLLEDCNIHRADLAREQVAVYTESMFRADGSSFPAACRVFPIERDGALAGSVVSFFDISRERDMESKIAEQATAVAEVARFPEMNPGPVLRLDLNDKVLMANTAARELLGSEIIGSSWRETCPEVDDDLWHSILETRQPQSLEGCIADRDYVFVHRRAPEGDRVFVFGSDVTELRQAQKALAEVARFPEMNPGPVLRTDLDGTVLLANAAAQDLLGDDLVGGNWFELGGSNISNCWSDVLQGEAPVTVEGTVQDHDYAFTHRRAPEGELVFVFGSDVTELRKAQRALSEVARFPEMNPGPVLRTDLDGTVLLANTAARSVIGNDVEECSWLDLAPDIVADRWGDVVTADGPVALEGFIGDRDFVFTHRRDAASELVFIFGADVTEHRRVEEELRQAEKMAALGKLSAGLAHELNNPAAAAERASEQLLKAQESVHAATISLSRAGIETDQWQALAERLVELRSQSAAPGSLSPLESSDLEEALADWLDDRAVDDAWTIAPVFVAAGLRSSDLLAITDGLTSDQLAAAVTWLCYAITAQDLATAVCKSTRSISELVNVVKSYSYMDRAPTQEIDVHAGIEDTLTILNHKLKHGFEVVREYDRELPRLLGKGSELNQVWTNLIDNAIDAMGAGGTLTIRTYEKDGEAVVEIRDDGEGVPAEIQQRIFDPFFTTKDVGEGTGLGLDVVRRIVVERCGGRIDLSSGSDGTTFTVHLPFAR